MREKVLEFLQKEINLEYIPGAVISVSYQGEIILEEAIGNRAVHPKKHPMQLDTIFDIASLTKVVATLLVILNSLKMGKSDWMIQFHSTGICTARKRRHNVETFTN